jgi:hypothetical protein
MSIILVIMLNSIGWAELTLEIEITTRMELVSDRKKHTYDTLIFLWHNKNLPLKKIRILIKLRRSAATSRHPPPPLAAAQSPKWCPLLFC